jgi:hypothetical protein
MYICLTYIMNIELSFQTVMPLLFVSFCASTVQDHYFDVVTNVVGLVAAVLGDKYLWWIDPVGAVLLAVYDCQLVQNCARKCRYLQSSLCQV